MVRHCFAFILRQIFLPTTFIHHLFLFSGTIQEEVWNFLPEPLVSNTFPKFTLHLSPNLWHGLVPWALPQVLQTLIHDMASNGLKDSSETLHYAPLIDLFRFDFHDKGALGSASEAQDLAFPIIPSGSASAACHDSLVLDGAQGPLLFNTHWAVHYILFQEMHFPESLTLRNAASTLLLPYQLFAFFFCVKSFLILPIRWMKRAVF